MALPPINGTLSQGAGAAPASQARLAAQRAFFDAALGRAQGAATVQTRSQAAPAPLQASARPTTIPRTEPAVAFDPNRHPNDPTARPGSIVNIRV